VVLLFTLTELATELEHTILWFDMTIW